MRPSRTPPSVLETDLYQLTMAYAYWKNGTHTAPAVFDYFFRTCPFKGEVAVTAGLADFIAFLARFHFDVNDLEYLKTGPLADCDPDFFDWLSHISAEEIKVYAIREGTAVFPRVPIVRIEGPLAIVQLLETHLLNALNFPSLITTYALRHRLAAGHEKTLLEFGLRRAQDGLRASHYAWIGGFDGTSNVKAAQRLGIPPKGTMAHSFVSSFFELQELHTQELQKKDGARENFVERVLHYRKILGYEHTNEGELTAFIAYAQAFPNGFLALVDTYDTLNSGVPNFIASALALHDFGYKAIGIRLDSGDLAKLSKAARKMFRGFDRMLGIALLSEVKIAASNDINEEILWSLRQQGHEIDTFGIGTHIATCQAQPAFGGVYKLVHIGTRDTIKLSNESAKVIIPGRKEAYRLIGEDKKAILDLMVEVGSDPPKVGERVLCRDPFNETNRVAVIPSAVIPLHELVWDGGLVSPLPSRKEVHNHVRSQLLTVKEDHLRPLNPTPYKVMVSNTLYDFMHHLWLEQAPVAVMK